MKYESERGAAARLTKRLVLPLAQSLGRLYTYVSMMIKIHYFIDFVKAYSLNFNCDFFLFASIIVSYCIAIIITMIKAG